MSETLYRGTITFVHYEKHFATIDYEHNGKAKTINFKTKPATGSGKQQHYRVGDEVSFKQKLTDRGDRMTAHSVKVLFNAALERLLQKAQHENRFSGYLKQVDDELFVKEMESYLFFPVVLSQWENRPGEQSMNAEVTFRLTNIDKPAKVGAELFFQVFIPEYRHALKALEQKTPVSATITKVSPYAVYVEMYDGKIGAKLNLPVAGLETPKPGDELNVLITYLSPHKIVVEKAG